MSVLAAPGLISTRARRARPGPVGASRAVAVAGAGLFAVAILALSMAVGKRRRLRRLQRGLGRICVASIHGAGGTFIKFAQVLATRADLFDAEFLTPFAAVQDRVPAVGYDALTAALPPAIAVDLASQFAEVSAQPFAGGSVAQVFLARSRAEDNRLAVKIVDPGKRRQTIADVMMMRRMVRLVQRCSPLRRIPLADAFHAMSRQVVLQFDMRREARFHRLCHDVLSGRDDVRCPRLSLTGRKYWLAMDYVTGVHRLDAETDAERRSHCLLTATRILFEMIFRRGVVHGDFHPGNILIDDAGRLVILDFGLAFGLTTSERRNLARFFMAIATNNADLAADVIVESARHVPADLDAASFRRAVAAFLDAVAGRSAGDFALAGFTRELFLIQSRHGIVSTIEFALPMLALLTLEGSLKRWYPALDFQREAMPYVIQAL